MKRLPLLWRVFLSTSLFTTVLFVLIAYLVQTHALRTTAEMLEEELRSSFGAYEALWRSRADYLGSIGKVISGMPDVRAAFGTGDRATIRDTAAELWRRVSPAEAMFLVTEPSGEVIASLGGDSPVPERIVAVPSAAREFPNQGSGFSFIGDRLYQVVITPVYVESAHGPALLNVLVAGFAVDHALAQRLKETTAGTDLMITARGQVIASTLGSDVSQRIAEAPPVADQLYQYEYEGERWSILGTTLSSMDGQPIGYLRFLRTHTEHSQRFAGLRLQIAAIWAAAILFGLLVTFVGARRLLRPIRLLDHAARDVARGNYEHRVPLDGDDEMGRLGRAFNAMCKSIRESRQELIRQERINTLGRIATSVVHDLRNPLAAIYSGAELLVDTEKMPAPHTQRLASNIYRASRQVLGLLDDLMALGRGNAHAEELCRISELLEDAWGTASSTGTTVEYSIAGDLTLEAPIVRARVERVFVNLFANSLQAMPFGGSIRVLIEQTPEAALITVRDTGPGVSPEIRQSLFQPFTTSGKSNGLGLGLALSRQALLDHGGNLTLEESESGACFRVTLPAGQRTLIVAAQ